MSAMSVDQIASLFSMALLAVVAGAFVGGLLLTLTHGIWVRLGEVLAEKVNQRNAQRAAELSARVWRLKRGQ